MRRYQEEWATALRRAAAARQAGRLTLAHRTYARVSRSAAAARATSTQTAALCGLGAVARDARDFPAAAAPLRRAVTLARRGRPQALAYAQRNLGVVHRHLGRLDTAVRLLAASRRAYLAAGDRHGAALALLHHGIALRLGRDFDRARAALLDSATDLRRYGRPHQWAVANLHAGLTDLDAGAASSARKRLTESLAEFRRLDEPRWVVTVTTIIADLDRGDPQ